MDNLEWLKIVDKFDFNNDMYNKLGAEEFLQYRKIKALEIIAEELVVFNKNFNSLIGGSVTHSIRTMSMMGG